MFRFTVQVSKTIMGDGQNEDLRFDFARESESIWAEVSPTRRDLASRPESGKSSPEWKWILVSISE